MLAPGQRGQFLKHTEANARRFEQEGLEAAARLTAAGCNIHVALVGGGAMDLTIRALRVRLGLAERVSIVDGFVDPAEAGKWAREYYEIIKSDQCVPIGHTVNANVAMVTGFS